MEGVGERDGDGGPFGHWEKVNICAPVDASNSRVEFAVDAGHHRVRYHVSTDT